MKDGVSVVTALDHLSVWERDPLRGVCLCAPLLRRIMTRPPALGGSGEGYCSNTDLPLVSLHSSSKWTHQLFADDHLRFGLGTQPTAHGPLFVAKLRYAVVNLESF